MNEPPWVIPYEQIYEHHAAYYSSLMEENKKLMSEYTKTLQELKKGHERAMGSFRLNYIEVAHKWLATNVLQSGTKLDVRLRRGGVFQYIVEVTVTPRGSDEPLTFEEPFEEFPSKVLQTKLIMVAGK